MPVITSQEPYLSERDYLEGEEYSDVPHEYLNGVVYAMAGGTREHAQIAGNIFGQLYVALRGKPCRPYNEAMRLRVQRESDLRFYYPDAMVVCRPSASNVWEDSPTVIVEVLSESTERTDREEKRNAYFGIGALRVYALIDSRRMEVTVFRREGETWGMQVLRTKEDRLAIPEIGCELSLVDIYEGVF